MPQYRHLTRGFSLIELIVLLGLLGVIFFALIIYLTGAQKSSRDAIRKNDIHSYYTALAHYYDDHHTYPTQKNGRGPDTTTAPQSESIFDGSGDNPLTSVNNVQQSYLKSVLRDPTDGAINCQTEPGSSYQPCQYSYLASPTAFTVWALLENPTADGGVYFANANGKIGYAKGQCSAAGSPPCQ